MAKVTGRWVKVTWEQYYKSTSGKFRAIGSKSCVEKWVPRRRARKGDR